MIQADIRIFTGTGRELDRDNFRLGDRAKRNALASGATASLAPSKLDGGKEEMQFLLRDFCDRLETAYIDDVGVDEVAGSAEREAPEWLAHGYVTRGAGTLLVGPPGVGKSWTGLLLAQSIRRGISSVFSVSGPTNVLYVNLERGAGGIMNRLGSVNRVLGLPPETPLPMVNARGKSLTDVHEAILFYVKAHPGTVVFLDSLSRTGMGSMVDDSVANEMMDALNSYGTWVALGHSPRPQPGRDGKLMTQHVFGSQMLTAAADFEVVLMAKEMVGRTLVGLKVIKTNDTGKVPFTGWNYHFDQSGLTDAVRVMNLDPDAFEDDEN